MCETISKNLILRKFSLKMTIFHQLSYFHIIMPILIWKHHVHVWTFYIPIRFSVHCESRGCNRIANHKDWAWSSICHLDQKYSAFLRFVLWSLKPCLLHFVAFFQVTCKWDHSFKTSANFQDFWTLPLPSAFQQNAYDGDFWPLCTVTVWPSANGDTPPPKTCWRLKWMVLLQEIFSSLLTFFYHF